jgi:hypothetical protein
MYCVSVTLSISLQYGVGFVLSFRFVSSLFTCFGNYEIYLQVPRIQLASNFSRFFGKLVDSLDQLSKEISFFQEVNEKCTPENSDRLKPILEEVFEDLLEYLIGVTRIFFRSDGSKSSTPYLFVLQNTHSAYESDQKQSSCLCSGDMEALSVRKHSGKDEIQSKSGKRRAHLIAIPDSQH